MLHAKRLPSPYFPDYGALPDAIRMNFHRYRLEVERTCAGGADFVQGTRYYSTRRRCSGERPLPNLVRITLAPERRQV